VGEGGASPGWPQASPSGLALSLRAVYGTYKYAGLAAAGNGVEASEDMGVQIGVRTPVVTRVEHGHEAWEAGATFRHVVNIAVEADRLGYHHLTCSEHVALPPGLSRGELYWEPLTTLSAIAAVTSRLRLLPYVIVLGLRHPLRVLKEIGTLQLISEGRIVLGCGIGNEPSEFAALNADFVNRATIADEALDAITQGLGKRIVSYMGRHFSYDQLVVDPCPTADTPIWVGGETLASLKRAIKYGSGWMPLLRNKESALEDLKAMLQEFDLPPQFEVVVTPALPFDPVSAPVDALEMIQAYRSAGATTLNANFVHMSRAHYLEQLAGLAEICTMA
jgi:probable F420-dependent oxidoreductase